MKNLRLALIIVAIASSAEGFLFAGICGDKLASTITQAVTDYKRCESQRHPSTQKPAQAKPKKSVSRV